jgi:hypothetical protein
LKGGYGDFDDPFTARNVFATGPYNHRVQLFDAYSPYNFYEWTRILPNETALQYFNKEAYHVSQRWAREVNFFPGLLSRYRDFRKPDHKLLGSPEEFEVMLQMVDKLPLRPVGNGIRHVIILTSFNEFFEGTSRLQSTATCTCACCGVTSRGEADTACTGATAIQRKYNHGRMQR